MRKIVLVDIHQKSYENDSFRDPTDQIDVSGTQNSDGTGFLGLL
jgi:hypothetical protein